MKVITKVEVDTSTPLTIAAIQGYLERGASVDTAAEIRNVRVTFSGRLKSFEVWSHRDDS